LSRVSHPDRRAIPGPWYLGADNQTIRHDNLPHPDGVVAVVIARLPDKDTLAQAARLTVARAMGMLW
jgi:hypothetical protein